MQYYIIQREERDTNVDLSNQLVEILTADLGIPKIDAKTQIKHFYGMLKVTEKKQAENISTDFRKSGLDNFILKEDELVTLPKRERLYGGLEEVSEVPELIAAGRIYQEKQQTTRDWSPLNIKVDCFGNPIRGSGMKERRTTKKQTTYYIDMITRNKRWGISKSTVPQKDIEYLEKLDLLKTYLTRDIRKMFQGQYNIICFSEQKYYTEYLTWLLQLVFAKPT